MLHCPNCKRLLANGYLQIVKEICKNYPGINNEFCSVLRSHKNKEYKSAAISMRLCLEAMVNFLLERHKITKSETLYENTNILFKQSIITNATCKNYACIRRIGNQASHYSPDNEINYSDYIKALNVLINELYLFLTEYAIVEPKIMVTTTKTKPPRIENKIAAFFRKGLIVLGILLLAIFLITLIAIFASAIYTFWKESFTSFFQ